AYARDPDPGAQILRQIAGARPLVVQSPPPAVFLLSFGESALEFELRCVVADVEKGLLAKSDLHYAIIKAFRKNGIEIPYPQRELRWRGQGAAPAEAPAGS